MKKHLPIVTYLLIAILVGWSIWGWYNFPKTSRTDPQLIQVIERQHARELEEKTKEAWDDGYQKREVDRAWEYGLNEFFNKL